MIKKLILSILLVAGFIAGVGILTQRAQKGQSLNIFEKPSSIPTFELKEISIGETKIFVELADTKNERARGLSNRDSLPENQGMLFVFDQKDTFPTFWMKDTKLPLDIIWIEDEKIAKINKNVQPEPDKSDRELTRYRPDSPIDYVLEVNAGFSDKNGLEVGNTVDLSQI